MSALSSIFVGVPQSRYAAMAILFAVVVVALTILFGRESIPLSQKFGFVLLVLLVSLPGIAMSLFQMTCIVSGSNNGKSWWCSWYAWILSALMIFYAIVLIASAVVALTTGNVSSQSQTEAFDDMNKNKMAAQVLAENFFAGNATSDESAPKPPADGALGAISNHMLKLAGAGADGFKIQGQSSIQAAVAGGNGMGQLPDQMPAQQVPVPASAAATPIPASPETFSTFGAVL
jgi:uncharacterized membrane protein